MQVKYYKQYHELIERCKAPDGCNHIWKELYFLTGLELYMGNESCMTFESCRFCNLKRGRLLYGVGTVSVFYSDKDVDYPALMEKA